MLTNGCQNVKDGDDFDTYDDDLGTYGDDLDTFNNDFDTFNNDFDTFDNDLVTFEDDFAPNHHFIARQGLLVTITRNDLFHHPIYHLQHSYLTKKLENTQFWCNEVAH